MRLVIDTNVIVKAFRAPSGASAALTRQIRNDRVVFLASPPLFFEYEQVLKRPEHLSAAGASGTDAENFLDVLASLVTPVEIHFLWRPQLNDPEDEMVLEAAINGGAEALVSFERETFTKATARFGIALMTPQDILARIGP